MLTNWLQNVFAGDVNNTQDLKNSSNLVRIKNHLAKDTYGSTISINFTFCNVIRTDN